jgi:hypothetical protein
MIPNRSALALLALFALLALPAPAQGEPSVVEQASQLARQGKRPAAIDLLGQSPDRGGAARYLLAGLLADERRAGRVCQSDAYRADASLRTKALRDGRFSLVHDTMAWQRLEGRSPSVASDVPALLIKVTFHGPGRGVFGSLAELDFQPGGRVRGWRSVWDDRTDTTKRLPFVATYRVEGRKVTITFKDGEWRGELGADGALEIEGEGRFTDEPSECEA